MSIKEDILKNEQIYDMHQLVKQSVCFSTTEMLKNLMLFLCFKNLQQNFLLFLAMHWKYWDKTDCSDWSLIELELYTSLILGQDSDKYLFHC